MSTTAGNLVDDFQATSVGKGVPDATAFLRLNEVDILVQRVLRTRKERQNLRLVAGTRQISLGEDVIWIERARYLTGPATETAPSSGTPLVEDTIDERDVMSPGWTGDGYGAPGKYAQNYNSTTGVMDLDLAPSDGTLQVSGATNATPIVITSSGDHGLADGDRVEQRDVGGNTAANGSFYAKVTGYSDTTYALYSDEDLTTPVAGNGAYTSGGLILCAGSPMIEIDVVFHDDLVEATVMPLTPWLRSLYVEGMCWLHAERRRKLSLAKEHRLAFENMLNEQDNIISRRAGRTQRRLNIVSTRATSYVDLTTRGW